MGRRRRIPAFGNWDYSDELPITQYFESAAQAGLIRDQCLSGDDKLSKPAAAPVKPVKKGGGKGEKLRRKQERECGVTPQDSSQRRPGRAPKAVDEDLYKIPPELLYQKPKKVGTEDVSSPLLSPPTNYYAAWLALNSRLLRAGAEEVPEESVARMSGTQLRHLRRKMKSCTHSSPVNGGM
ncbi:hypothetical protein GW17_00055555 [Ensete ventricosum]|uniref:Uncharacterized protein n=1 Tax=Ensete ventricosum TaxID=4639 RepID=A0A444CAQ4_ENSVE|nr:hypothetical protein GW17_00055555 [Ensete ventricosum]RZR75033.1 hypothetical protein BHM03_00048334 [Ensete ventricosum]